jgi:hypothetical protein
MFSLRLEYKAAVIAFEAKQMRNNGEEVLMNTNNGQTGRSIGDIISGFITAISSLRSTLPILMRALAATAVKDGHKLKNFVDSLCTPGEGAVIHVPTELHNHFLEMQRKVERLVIAVNLVPNSFLVSLVSQYDSFLSELLTSIFNARPELLLGSERSLTFKELSSFGSLADARAFIIDKEIESVLRKSHSEQFDWMENRFKLPEDREKFTLRKDLPSWSTFVELTERRNLFAHCNGVATAQYLKICSGHGIDCQSIAVGSKLDITPEYFRAAWECVFEIAVKLSQVLWRKLLPSDGTKADHSLIDITYGLIVERKYRLAINLLEFATIIQKKLSTDDLRRRIVLNKAQAYKWMGDPQKASNVVNAEDWSSSADLFKLAVAVLRDDFDDAAKIMRRIGAEGSPTIHAYQNWPIFQEFRKTPQFREAYLSVFKQPFVTVEEALRSESSPKLPDVGLAATDSERPASDDRPDDDTQDSEGPALVN